jgi:Ohr subfamily peroxiredoxin
MSVNAPEKIVYTAHASATGGRDGHARSDDGALDIKLVAPKELGGKGVGGTNPEQLFAAGYSACFIGALGHVARQQKKALPEGTEVSGAVGLGPILTGFAITVELTVKLPGMDKDAAHKLVEEAHVVCPYSNATRGNIDVQFKLV